MENTQTLKITVVKLILEWFIVFKVALTCFGDDLIS
jgi:hypothetical protein